MNKQVTEVAKEKNHKKVFKKTNFENVKVGDLIKVYKNQEFPADICFLSGSGK
jgi:magnesium-transporting ATPase (P-type)